MSEISDTQRAVMYSNSLKPAQKELIFKATCQILASAIETGQIGHDTIEHTFDEKFKILEEKFKKYCV